MKMNASLDDMVTEVPINPLKSTIVCLGASAVSYGLIVAGMHTENDYLLGAVSTAFGISSTVFISSLYATGYQLCRNLFENVDETIRHLDKPSS